MNERVKLSTKQPVFTLKGIKPAHRHYGRTQQAMVFGDPDRVLVILEK